MLGLERVVNGTVVGTLVCVMFAVVGVARAVSGLIVSVNCRNALMCSSELWG